MRLAKAALNKTHGALVFRRRVQILADLLQSEIPTGTHILDVGTGDGSIAASIASKRPDLTIEGLDVLVRPNAQIAVAAFDGAHIPFDNGSVDVVSFVDVLHHTDDPLILLREAARVARRYVLIKDHLRDGLFATQTLRFMDWVGNYGHDVVLPYNYLRSADWHRLFREASLEPKEWNGNLKLYPFPMSMLFGRGLHFITLLSVGAK